MTLTLPLSSETSDFKFRGKSHQCPYKSEIFQDLSQSFRLGIKKQNKIKKNLKGEPTAVVAKETSCIVIQVINQYIFPCSQPWWWKYHH